MTDSDGTYGTADLVEATILVSRHYFYELERVSSTQARWVFDLPEDESSRNLFRGVVANYQEGRMRVEPRSFLKEVRALREELYRFLGDSAPKRPTAAV